MTNQVIPAEAVEAAETAYYETLTELRLQEGGGFKAASQVKRSIRAALEAAAPYMQAGALEAAAAEVDEGVGAHGQEEYADWLRERAAAERGGELSSSSTLGPNDS